MKKPGGTYMANHGPPLHTRYKSQKGTGTTRTTVQNIQYFRFGHRYEERIKPLLLLEAIARQHSDDNYY